MSNEKELSNIGHVSKCGGIPMYPSIYKFEMECPIEVTKEHDENRRKRLAKFLGKYGLKLVDFE